MTTKVKNVKKVREDVEIAQEKFDTIQKMVKDREAKCKAAKEQLVDMLNVTVDKYMTATGVAEALRMLRFTYGNDEFDNMENACALARFMASKCNNMAELAADLEYDKMDEICKDVYDPSFANGDKDLFDLAKELMTIDLCRNVGPAADDLTSFVKRTNDEIENAQRDLDEFLAQHEDVKLEDLAKSYDERVVNDD